MENKVLEQNLTVISKYNKNLVNKILTTDVKKSNISLFQMQNGQYNLLIDSVAVHNLDNALEESRQVVKDIQDDGITIRIVYGIGLGYLIDEMASKVTSSFIILYEPDIDVLRYVLSIAVIDALFKRNVLVASSKEELLDIISKISNKNSELSISFLKYHLTYFKSDIEDILSATERKIGEKKAIDNTVIKNQCPAIKHTLMNLKNTLKNPDISQLKDIYKGKTALVVSAGASLNENIETLKEIKDKAVIFVVSQAVNTLIENDINPDFVLSIDIFDNSAHFKKLNKKETYFIFEDFISNKVHSLKSKKTINYISKECFINPWVREILEINHSLETIGTVSYSALMSAFEMGFDKIVLIGQDLAYKNGKCYAKGCVGDSLECVLENDKYVVKMKDYEAFREAMKNPKESEEDFKKRVKAYLDSMNNAICTIKAQDNSLLPTQISYSFFVEYFAAAAGKIKAQKPNINLINSSTGGAQIDGFINLDLKEAFKDEKPTEKIDLTSIKPKYNKDKAFRMIDELEKEFIYVQKDLDEFNETNKKLLEELKNENKITENIKKLIQKHKEIFDKFVRYDKHFIVQNLLYFRFENCQNACEINENETIENLIKSLESYIETYKSREFRYYFKYLADCKSFIRK